MTQEDSLSAVKAELVELEQELSERLAEMDRADNRPKMDTAVGRLTFMDEMQQYEMAKHGRRNIESQLAQVRAAMSRIDDGTYGTCVGCGGPIPPERLEVMPETAYCVKCRK